MALSIGEVIRGKYRLLRLLGDGGMGSVYEASHELLGTRVAIKVLHSDLARRTGLVDRFIQEARVAAQIKSPHVVHVTDVDRTETGVAYIVMELLEGESLAAMLDRQGKMPIPTACDYTSQILQALEAAHALGVVHRDLKPENVFVTYAAGRPVLKLIDFGIAKLRSSVPGERSLTVAGVTMGTAEYMAPEQAYSADKVDARSDLYAVGVLLYEMIAAQRPVSGEDARSIAAKVERGEVIPLVHAVPEVPREIAGLVHRAMAPRPELRFASAAEMRIALEAAMAGKRLPTAQTPLPQPAGRTVAGAPMSAAFAPGPMPPMEAAPRTERVGPSPLAMTPPAPMVATPVTRIPSSPRSRKRGGVSWMWIVMPLLLGAGVVAAVVAMNARDTASPVPIAPALPTPTTLTSAPPPAVATPTATATIPVAPLNPSPYVPSPPAPRASSDAGRAPHTPPAAPSANPFPPFALPSALPFPLSFDGGAPVLPFPIPSGFPSAFPSGFPTALPSAFPFPFPGAPSASPKQPEEAPSSSPKTF